MYSSDKYPIVKLLNHMEILFLAFWEISIQFFIVATPVYIPINSVWKFSFLHILSNTQYFLSFHNGHSNGHKVISHCGLICISLIINNTEHIFFYTCWPSVYVFGKMSIQVLCLFFNQVVWFCCCCYWVAWVLYIFWL